MRTLLQVHILRAWPAFLAVYDVSGSSSTGSEGNWRGGGGGGLPVRDGLLLSAISLLGRVPAAARGLFWARHWACALDTLSRATEAAAALWQLSGGASGSREAEGRLLNSKAWHGISTAHQFAKDMTPFLLAGMKSVAQIRSLYGLVVRWGRLAITVIMWAQRAACMECMA